MQAKRFSEEQIIRALKRHETGEKVLDLCRELGISKQTFHRWKDKFGGMGLREGHRLDTLGLQALLGLARLLSWESQRIALAEKMGKTVLGPREQSGRKAGLS